jgi:hypothetical protein
VPDPSEITQVSLSRPDDAEGELLDAVRALSTQVSSLQNEVHALRAASARLPEGEQHGWDESAPSSLRDGGAWVRSLDAPRLSRLSVPWLALEIGFLVAVAVLAGVADFGTAGIVTVMVLAWGIVAAAEWGAARAAARRHALAYGTFTPGGRSAEDRSWLSPPGQRTLVEVPPPPAPVDASDE